MPGFVGDQLYQGLSPRGRGNRPMGIWNRVYPRVGGGTWLATTPYSFRCMGLSPRGRGNPGYPPTSPGCRQDAVYPRVGGGTPMGNLITERRGRVYPRVGGGTDGARPIRIVPCGRRVYPRVGGGTPCRILDPVPIQAYRVYPRVGGGTSSFQ